MTIYQPVSPYTKSIVRPPCPACGTQMTLAKIEPDKPNHDKRTFECPKCKHEENVIVKFE